MKYPTVITSHYDQKQGDDLRKEVFGQTAYGFQVDKAAYILKNIKNSLIFVRIYY